MSATRQTKNDCIVCSKEVPLNVELEENGQHRTFRCSSCGDKIVEGAVASSPQVTDCNIPPSALTSVYVPPRTTFDSWETWWSDYTTTVGIHGRHTAGSEDLFALVKKLYDIYDS